MGRMYKTQSQYARYGRNTGEIKHLWYGNAFSSAFFLPIVISEVLAPCPVEWAQATTKA